MVLLPYEYMDDLCHRVVFAVQLAPCHPHLRVDRHLHGNQCSPRAAPIHQLHLVLFGSPLLCSAAGVSRSPSAADAAPITASAIAVATAATA